MEKNLETNKEIKIFFKTKSTGNLFQLSNWLVENKYPVTINLMSQEIFDNTNKEKDEVSFHLSWGGDLNLVQPNPDIVITSNKNDYNDINNDPIVIVAPEDGTIGFLITALSTVLNL